MRKKISEYIDRLIQTARDIQVTKQGNIGHVSFFEGIEQSIGIIMKVKDSGRKIMIIGNGGSASIASHFSIDFWHTHGIKSTAFNDPALLTCLSNDHGYENVFSMAIQAFANAGDLLFAISSSGQSQNILKGAEAAFSKECYIITLSGFEPGNPLRAGGHLNFYVPISHYGYVESLHSIILHCMLDNFYLVHEKI